ncbi:MAG: hypothetical protein HGA31_02160 [Candidatus Moranbacteria bacterium]|nr:hypothetical protein [Candidatus Moranbacteria bacterium]
MGILASSQTNGAPTMALDFVTIMRALLELERAYLGQGRIWQAKNQPQKRLIALYALFRDQLEGLHSLKAKAATDADVLNTFLAENGFGPMFDALNGGIGVASILDMLIEWVETGEKCDIDSAGTKYPGFEIKKDAFEAFEVPGNIAPLLRLKTKTGDSLWLHIPNAVPETAFDMACSVFDLMRNRKSLAHSYTSVKIPMVDMDIEPDLSFLIGMGTVDESGNEWSVSEAIQRFKLRMNDKGARAKVATGIVMRGVSFTLKNAYVVDRPFLVWMTQGESTLPLAPTMAGRDSWKATSGFEDM